MLDINDFIAIDLPALLATIFSACSCALIGNYLVLRKMSLMGDSISHSVLPGIVIAFLLTSSRDSLSVFIGATLAGIVSTVFIELIRKYGKVDAGAAMGVVFSVFFAAGVILIEQAAARNIDLDADCLLHGQLESIFWSPPPSFNLSALTLLPSEVQVSFFTLLSVLIFILILYKELKISTFDPGLANALGFNSSLINNLLMIIIACCVVSSFKIVGSILVIAMLICPAACARLLTNSLKSQLTCSLLVALMASVSGYFLGAFGPQFLFNYPNSLSASGMITVVLGVMLFASIVFYYFRIKKHTSVQ